MNLLNRVGRVVQACRMCGCTQHDACVDDDGLGCWWVEPDLCSACADVEELSVCEEVCS